MAKEKIGVYGSAVSDSETLHTKARELGEILAEEDVILVTGACSGLPYKVVSAAYENGRTEIWGFSPATDYEGQLAFTPKDDITIYARLIYVPTDVEFASQLDICIK